MGCGMDGHDVGVVEAGGGLGFPEKAAGAGGGGARGFLDGRAENFDGHGAIECVIVGEINGAHPALAKLAEKAVGAQGVLDAGRWRGHKKGG